VPSRGLLLVGALVGIALTCLASLRKLEREHRLLAKLRTAGKALVLDDLSDDERDAAQSLADAGVVGIQQQRLTLKPAAVADFRQKRLRLAISGALGAFLIACLVVFFILHR
jgi:hypothetical protein